MSGKRIIPLVYENNDDAVKIVNNDCKVLVCLACVPFKNVSDIDNTFTYQPKRAVIDTYSPYTEIDFEIWEQLHKKEISTNDLTPQFKMSKQNVGLVRIQLKSLDGTYLDINHKSWVTAIATNRSNKKYKIKLGYAGILSDLRLHASPRDGETSHLSVP